MNENKYRLQFVHCNTLFATRDEAISYVSGDIDQINRPSLYAEPMILKYGNASNPSILLAIGSVGDGTTQSENNKTFYIDFDKAESEISSLQDGTKASAEQIDRINEVIGALVKSCGTNDDGTFSPFTDDALLKNSTSFKEGMTKLSEYIQYVDKKTTIKASDGLTLHLSTSVGESATTITGEVILDENRVFSGDAYDNIILSGSEGLFSNVSLSYDKESGDLGFIVNGEKKEIPIPKDTHVSRIYYDKTIESLIFLYNGTTTFLDKNGKEYSGDTLTISMNDLIEEWYGDAGTSTPIILSKKRIIYDSENDLHKDVLSGDIRLDTDTPYNILEKSSDGRSLLVKGIASNIKYWKQGKLTNVSDALDDISLDVSSSEGNIIYTRNDGVYAHIDLDYDTSTNKLILYATSGGTSISKTIQLNGVKLFDDISYDSTNEQIRLRYTDSTGNYKYVDIPVGNIITEWNVDNSSTNVTLTRTRNVSGTDLLSAEAKVSSDSSNILKVTSGHELYVNGSSSNIIYLGTLTVYDAISSLSAASETAKNSIGIISAKTDSSEAKITSEIARAKDAESYLSGYSKDLSSEISSQNSSIQAILSSTKDNKDAISAETDRAKGAEQTLSNSVTAITLNVNSLVDSANTINGKVEAISSDLTSEIDRATKKENELYSSLTAVTSSEEVLNSTVSELKTHVDKNASDIETLQNSSIDSGSKITTLENSVTSIKESASTLNSSLEKEITRASNAESTLKSSIDEVSGQVKDQKSTIEANQLYLSSKIDNLSSSTDTKISNVNASIASDKNDLAEEISRSTKADEALSATVKSMQLIATDGNAFDLSITTAATSTTISGDVKISAENGNIITNNGGLYAYVTLDYNSGTNYLSIKSEKGEITGFNLNSYSVFEKMYIDSTDKDNPKLVILYKDSSGVEQTISVNVSSFFQPLEFDNGDISKGIILSAYTEGNVKYLYGKVQVSDLSSNSLVIDNNRNLYVPNSASQYWMDDSKTVSVKDAIEELQKQTGGTSSSLTAKTTSSITTTIASGYISGVVNISATEGNVLSTNSDGLYASYDTDFGTY